MKALTSLLAIASLVSTAHADQWENDPDMVLYRLGVTMEKAETNGLEPAQCATYLAKLRSLKVPATRTIETIYTTEWLPAGVHALPAVSKACDAMQYAKRVGMVKDSIRYAVEIPNTFKACVEFWPEAIAAGVRPTERMDVKTKTYDGVDIHLTGTLEELKKRHCDDVAAARDAAKAARVAAVRKALRNDKADLYFDIPDAIVLQNDDDSMDLRKLAAARVWFWIRSGHPRCADGRTRYLVTRYQFDKNHKLVKERTKETCGSYALR